MRTHLICRAALGLGLTALVLSPATAQGGADDFYKAYYLQHEKGDLQGALAIYQEIAASRGASKEMRAKAHELARAATEGLASRDFAKLMPSDAIFYVEFNRPGAQLKSLLDQFGLLAEGTGSWGISPLLVDGVLGCRGIAAAVDEIDPRHGPRGGVLIVHPGSLDAVRGLLETALPVAAQPVDPIDEYATYSIEGRAYVTLTSHLAIASESRAKIEGVLRRMHGKGSPSLADNANLTSTMEMRGNDLMFCCVNLEPIMPTLMQMVSREAPPQARAAMAFMDLRSLRSIAGRAGVNENGLSFDMAVQLDEDHHNVVFNLLRMPNISPETLRSIPAGAAFFAAASFNGTGDLPEGPQSAKGEPIVTLMDFGRELFANLVDVSIYAMPTTHDSQWGPIPDVVLSARVNDPKKSAALWDFVLNTAQVASGGGEAETTQRGDLTIQRYKIQGVPIYVGTQGKLVFVSPSTSAIESSIRARAAGRTVLEDPAFATAVAQMGEDSVRAMAFNAGRCFELARSFMSEREQRQVEQYVQLIRETTACIAVTQSADRLGVSGRVCNLPNVGPMVRQLVDRQLGKGRDGQARRRVGTVDAPVEATQTPRPRRTIK